MLEASSYMCNSKMSSRVSLTVNKLRLPGAGAMGRSQEPTVDQGLCVDSQYPRIKRNHRTAQLGMTSFNKRRSVSRKAELP